MIFSSISDIETLQWTNLLSQSATASFFQSPACYNFYASIPFMKPFVFGVSEDDQLVGIMCGYVIADGNCLKRFFSRRAIVPGGLLLDNHISTEALTKLLNIANHELSSQAIYVEVRNYSDYSTFRSSFESAGFFYNKHLNFHIKTDDAEQVLKGLSSSKRRQIKLSLKAGAKIEEAKTSLDIEAYYAILKDLYKQKVKSPLFSIDFFNQLILLENAKILVVKINETVIGGITIVMTEKMTVYEWFVCGIDGYEKNLYPSVLATYAGIEYAAKHGFERFDFMGAGKPDEDYGVREFKSKFGGELVENGRFLLICKPNLYSLGKFIVKIIKRRK